MGIYNAAAFVPKLDVTDSNFYQRNSSMKVYATIHDATEVLDGTKKVPKLPSYTGLTPALQLHLLEHNQEDAQASLCAYTAAANITVLVIVAE
jgi:hypothetical protein